MISRIFKFIFNRVRPEFIYPSIVVVTAGIFSLAYVALGVAFSILSMGYTINWEFIGYLTGCIGLGELGRAIWRLHGPAWKNDKGFMSTFVAGGLAISSFTLIVGLKWDYPFWVSLVAFPGGGAFYLLLIGAHKIDQWCWNRF